MKIERRDRDQICICVHTKGITGSEGLINSCNGELSIILALMSDKITELNFFTAGLRLRSSELLEI